MASAGAITPATMPTNNLRALERQLEEENTMLTANFNQLKMAQQKFTDAAAVVGALTPDKKGAQKNARRCCSAPPFRPASPSLFPSLGRPRDPGAPDRVPVRGGRH